MTKGTTSFGRRNRVKTHCLCVRCGHRSYHRQKKVCASCGFGFSTHIRRYNWALKAQRRRTTGTGRTAHIREIMRKARTLRRLVQASESQTLKIRKHMVKNAIW